MARVPFIGRLYYREYVAVIFGFFFVAFEALLRFVIFFLPDRVIQWCHDRTRQLFTGESPKTPTIEERRAQDIRVAVEFGELCDIYGYKWEEHIAQTEDGYFLGLHRIPYAPGEEVRRRKPVVYLHHGLLMCSDVFLCTTAAERSLPLVLADAGYDVWLGNNRGNKYSRKHKSHNPHETAFWNFCIDEFAMRDIPDCIEYILKVTGEKSLSYVGFSQGTAQAFAALSVNPALNKKVDVFVALAPAMSPPGLSAPLVDGLMKASPALMYLFFGRRSILSSATMWQSILYPPIFSSIINRSLSFLFNWSGANISPTQRIAAYAHLYSATSTKAVVHWFQIMRGAEFTMYDDDVQSTSPAVRARTRSRFDPAGSGGTSLTGRWAGQPHFYYRPARFPTRNIAAPVVLLYGTRDSLVHIEVMLAQLPESTAAVPLEGYEHLDILWGDRVDRDVIPRVLEALQTHRRGGLWKHEQETKSETVSTLNGDVNSE